jgi:hypothetical protein
VQNCEGTRNSIEFFIIYVPSQQPQGQLQTKHNVDTQHEDKDKLQASTGGKHSNADK